MNKMQTLKRLASYLKPYKYKALMVIFLLLIVMGTNTLTPYLMKVSIDNYVFNNNINGLVGICGILVLLNILTMLISKIRVVAMSKVTNSILIDIRNELYTHIQGLSFGFFDNKPVGKIISRIVGDVNALQNLLNNSIVNLIPNIFTVTIVLIMMLFLNPALTLICITVLPILLGAMFYIEVKAHKLWKGYRDNRSSLIGYTHESLSGMKVVQGFSNEDYSLKKYLGFLDNHRDSFLTAVKFQDYFWPFVDITSSLGSLVVLVGGYYLVNSSQSVSLGTLMAFLMYVGMLWRPIMNLASFYNAFITNLSAGERIFTILDTPFEKNEEDSDKLPPIKGEIEFKDVTFSYTEDGIAALKDTSFKINAGEKVALVGETGAGKTTITSLISKFYTQNEGNILIDGFDIKNVNLESLRSQMGIMLQDSFLFSSSVKENIKYGKLNATDEEIYEACKAVNAHSFISKLEDGYDTNVNERGSRLSLGQRQLLAFARTLISNPKILILDEATANIDTETELLVQEGIKKLMEGRTSIVIAHRLSTIRDCDKIFVLSQGEIVESGNHEELLAKKGYYYNLYIAQYSFLND
ncbi:MAG: ABC transporter ATP-binding protein [Clostridium sp.]